MFDAEKCEGDRRLRRISRNTPVNCLFSSRIFCSYFPTPFLSLFHRYRWLASARRIVLSSFFFFAYLGPYCVTVRIRFWNFHSGRCRTVVSPRIAAGGPVNIASSVIHRHFAILSLRVASRSCMATREWINAATGRGWVWVRADWANLKHDCRVSRPEKIAGFI